MFTTVASADAPLVIRRLVEAWNSHDLARIESLYAPNCDGYDIGDGDHLSGREGVRENMSRYIHAFPDLQITCEDYVAQDERMAFTWTARGTHSGPLMNIPPTGLAVVVRGSSFLALRENLIFESRHIWDMAGLLRGIRLLPDL